MQFTSILQPVEIFRADEGYPNYRIPSLCEARDGTLIAIAEGRTHEDPGDGGSIDLVCRRSADNGASWSEMAVLSSGGSASNATSLLDRQTARLWVLFNRWAAGYGEANCRRGMPDNTAWATCSDDAGITWSSPHDITAQARDIEQWSSIAFGPGSGIQTRSGRLIVPGYRYKDGACSFAIYSDDHGTTWRRGAPLPGGNHSNECQVIELTDGRILIDARSVIEESRVPRLCAISADGGESWSSPWRGHSAAPISASLARVGDCILWSGPAGPGRTNLCLRVSRDEGRTFEHQTLLHEGYCGYSCMQPLAPNRIGILWEINAGRTIAFATFDVEE